MRAYRQLAKAQRRLPKYYVFSAVLLFAVCVVLLVWNMTSTHRPSPRKNAHYANALEERAVRELNSFGDWLDRNNAKGFIGELGWPEGADVPMWNAVADQWYQAADSYDLWTTAWAAGSWWSDYPLTIYTKNPSKPYLGTANAQATIVEKYKTNTFGDHRGVNMAGMEFGDGLTNTSPGVAGVDYFYEPAESFKYVASRGITTVRLPFRWERVQPTLNGPLKDTEIKEIRTMLDAAAANRVGVILDLHNYGGYKTAQGELTLGDGALTDRQLVDVWVRISQAFKGHPALLGYGLMNEPHDLPSGTYASPAKNWEHISQSAVTALRAQGDTTLVLVAGYDWSSLARWQQTHPKGWIDDPAHNFRYEAHHYWDQDGRGEYPLSFQQELTTLH